MPRSDDWLTMKTKFCYFATLLLLLVFSSTRGASLFEKLGFKKPSAATSSILTTALSQDEVANGLKQALGKGVQQAVSVLGKENGFLSDSSVRIPVPEGLKAWNAACVPSVKTIWRTSLSRP